MDAPSRLQTDVFHRQEAEVAHIHEAWPLL